jgi:outer membrane protein
MKQLLLLLKTSGFCVALICFAAFTATAQEKISLQRAVDLALQNNLTIKQSAFTEAFDAATYQQSKNNQLPSVSAQVNATENFGRALDITTYQYTSNRSVTAINPSVNAQVTLFQGGQLRNQIIQNRLLVDADKSNTAKIKNDLILNVVIDYLQILTNLDLVTAAKQQIDIANLTLDRTSKSVKAGNQTMADLSQAKAGLSTAELGLTNAQNQLELSILILKQYMEIPPTTQIIVEKPDISKLTDVKTTFDAQEILATALNVNPDVKLAEAQQAVSAQGIKIAQGGFYPTLSFFTGLSSNYSSLNNTKVTGTVDVTRQIGFVDGTTPRQGVSTILQQSVTAPYYFGSQLSDNFAQAVGFSLQIPIFNKFNAHTNVKKAKISYENAAITTQIARNNLTKTIIQAVWDAKASEKQYQSTLQTYQANKDAFNVIQQRYNVGLENSLNYNTSLTNFNKSQNDLIQARYQMVFRSKVIDYYLGNPITL